MAFQDLTDLEILQGSLALIWVIIAIIIGLRIIFKAYKLHRTKDLITVGFSYIFVSSAWFGVAFQFISYGFFDIIIDTFTYLLISNIFIPLALLSWIYSYNKIINPVYKTKLITIFSIIAAIWEGFVILGLIINTDFIGKLYGIFDSSHSIFMLGFILIGIITFLITGTLFAFKSMKLDDPEIQIKGKFLLFAWISFAVGAILDAALPLTALSLIIIRIVLISSAIEFYFGFFLPKKLSEKMVS